MRLKPRPSSVTGAAPWAPGRDFELRLEPRHGCPSGRALRIAVSDTRTEHRPPGPDAVPVPAPLATTDRGLPLPTALGVRWTVQDRTPAPGKTVLAELDPDASAAGRGPG